MSIAITGATGQLGRLVVDLLKEKVPSDQIIALVRSTTKAGDLGVAAREANYNQPETLDKAFAGVNTLLFISSNEAGQRGIQHQNVIDAAKRAGAKRVIYTSLLRADSSPLNLAGEHYHTEVYLRASGVPFTILRNGWYTENYTGSISGALAGGAFLGSAGNGKISSATRADFAEAAATVSIGEGHEGKVYELAGDDSWTLSDLAGEISRQTGRTIPYRDLPEAEYAAALSGFGLPPGFAHALASWDVSASQGALFDDSRQLSKLIGRPTTPLSVAVADALKQAA